MKVLFIAIFFFAASYTFAQTKDTFCDSESLPPIKLLPGYAHEVGRCTDTIDGTITKENGIKIYYDIGSPAGNYALFHYKKGKKDLVWSKVQKNNGLKVRITYLKDGSIYATFGKWTNFISTVKTDEELADFMNMIMSYGADEESTNKKSKK